MEHAGVDLIAAMISWKVSVFFKEIATTMGLDVCMSYSILLRLDCFSTAMYVCVMYINEKQVYIYNVF